MCIIFLLQETMMTPRSRKPVLLISGTNITKLPEVEAEESEPFSKKPKSEISDSLSSPFQDYLCSRSILTTPTDLNFSSCTDDYDSTNFDNISSDKLSSSLLYCLDGNDPEQHEQQEKELILKPKQYDENGKPIVFETSF